jgi:putative transposase
MKGRKQHIAVDTLGFLLAAVVHSAGISDTRGVRLLLIRLSMMFTLAKIFVDGGYKQGCIDWAKAMFGVVLEVVKRTDTAFKIMPKRWIIERTFAWLSFDRIHNRDCHHNPKSSEAAIYASSVKFLLNRLAMLN